MSGDLILYFSRAGENYYEGDLKVVEKVSLSDIEWISICLYYTKTRITNGDVFKVEPEIPYPEDYMECTEVTKNEKNGRVLKETLEDVGDYEGVYIGFPIWWGKMPIVFESQLNKLDFKGKVVKPFVTHEGSGFGKSKKQLKKLCKGADIRNGLEIKGSDVLGSKDKVKCWINDNL